MSQELLPVNELEAQLLALFQKKIDLALFLQVLLQSQIVVLLDREVNESQPNLNMNPLILQGPNGFDVLATFTSPERATPWTERFSDYRYALMTDCRWLLKGITAEVGFPLNLGWEFGLEIPPVGLQKIIKDFAVK